MNLSLLRSRPIWLSLMLGALLLLVLLTYRLLLASPVSQVAELQRRLASEQHSLSTARELAGIDEAVRAAEQRVEHLQDQTSLRIDVRSAEAIVPEVVRLLDTLSLKHEVRLESVVPLQERRVEQFRELPFDVAIKGQYRNLYQWLAEAEELLNPMTVRRLTVSVAGESGSVSMLLQLSSYRLESS